MDLCGIIIDGRIRKASLCFHIYACPYYQFSKYSTGRLRTREQICAIYSRHYLILYCTSMVPKQKSWWNGLLHQNLPCSIDPTPGIASTNVGDLWYEKLGRKIPCMIVHKLQVSKSRCFWRKSPFHQHFCWSAFTTSLRLLVASWPALRPG